jgi:hypothetical protein
MVLLVTYDLNKNKDYPALYQAIKNLGEWVKDPDLDSVWFVSTSLSATDASAKLTPHMDSDDRLFVSRIRTGEYEGWLHRDLWTWISSRA